eukprot:TRINITY_DN20402_c0_g1_i1.p1 TRINITY_DN20402_c0_g1~~TRINITY_DN20402_c0_g1_i1.p1  ORF type:complete len:1014 (+),score=311.92 TRINITY_DN20402_c0_g1_i1:62-3103(+)
MPQCVAAARAPAPARAAPASPDVAAFLEEMDALVAGSGVVGHALYTAYAENTLPNLPEALRLHTAQYRAFAAPFVGYIDAILAHGDEEAASVLRENLAEEQGGLDADGAAELTANGMDPADVAGVPHKELAARFAKAISAPELRDAEHMPEVLHLRDTMWALCRQSACAGVAALCYGSEAIVRDQYTQFYAGVQHAFPKLPARDTVFFPLHILCDDGHAAALQRLAGGYAATAAGREEMHAAAAQILAARRQFCDAMYEKATALAPAAPAALYDKQSGNWARTKPLCLSDFTARPKIFDLCAPGLEGARVLDLGCGEGYCARELKKRGAGRYVGMDISEKMIDAAKALETAEPLGIEYVAGSACDAVQTLRAHALPMEYDLVIAVFLFNYVTTEDMRTIMQQAESVLRPGGRFIFSVPHPAFPFWKRPSAQKFPFCFELDEAGGGYFAARDQLFSGKIWRVDGVDLNVQCVHKTLDDYTRAIQATFAVAGAGAAVNLTELHADERLQELMPEFFGNLDGIPLHCAFHVEKPDTSSMVVAGWERNAWPPGIARHPAAHTVPVPAVLAHAFAGVYRAWTAAGITAESVQTADLDAHREVAERLRALAGPLRERLAGAGTKLGFGLVDARSVLAAVGPDEGDGALRMFYYLLAAQLGGVMEKRGRLYDVYNRGLDVREEDVLFSATNAASGYHTDSTDRFYFPDVVGLMCLHADNSPANAAADAGTLYLANACNVYGQVIDDAPGRVVRALHTPLVRDYIGKGFGGCGAKPQQLLADNKTPLFAPSRNPAASQSLTARYMRFWTEAGHAKVGLAVPKDAAAAMDAVDAAIAHDVPLIKVRLERGQMIFTNNHTIMHHRTAYEDRPEGPRRHMVRVWVGLSGGDAFLPVAAPAQAPAAQAQAEADGPRMDLRQLHATLVAMERRADAAERRAGAAEALMKQLADRLAPPPAKPERQAASVGRACPAPFSAPPRADPLRRTPGASPHRHPPVARTLGRPPVKAHERSRTAAVSHAPRS